MPNVHMNSFSVVLTFVEVMTQGEWYCFLYVGDTLSAGQIVGILIAVTVIIVIIIVDGIVVVLVLRRLRSRLYRFHMTFLPIFFL